MERLENSKVASVMLMELNMTLFRNAVNRGFELHLKGHLKNGISLVSKPLRSLEGSFSNAHCKNCGL